MDAQGVAPTLTPAAVVQDVLTVRCMAAGRDDIPSEGDGAAADLAFHAFPTLDQLVEATEQALRDSGFGYRCDAKQLIECLQQCQPPVRNPEVKGPTMMQTRSAPCFSVRQSAQTS